ncbi:decaprenyl diphosphate synthase subunit 1 qless isoform X1 [Tachypleus tridentatus]|uniref:decaprenyl diphosphate synthase subunit 1 qless isoform X1 n=2 Tax=Tachypleus tridentatus TaxID=6853 RepID=UPI003FD40809
MASGVSCRVPSVVDRLWAFMGMMRLKRLRSPVVKWLNISSSGFWKERKLSGCCTSCSVHPCKYAQLQTSCFGVFLSETFSTSCLWSQVPVVNKPGTDSEVFPDPHKLVAADLADMYLEIKKELWVPKKDLEQISSYYFDGQGKVFRPMLVCLVSRALHFHIHHEKRLLDSQRKIALVSEIIHTASLIHDDVIDTSDARRGKPSVNLIWGQKKAILAGDFILSKAAKILAKVGSEEVILMLSEVLLDLVQGEFMQMGSKENESERFSHYLQKTFKKTASLMAYTCKAVAYLAGADEELQESAFQYGRNVGIAFQLIDDLLDFVSSQAEMGKPATADLRLGLATAPVLFACEKFPELNFLIMRRFSESNDVERAYEAVMKSDGLEHTRMLAQKHCTEAVRHITLWSDCLEKKALVTLANKVLNRKK